MFANAGPQPLQYGEAAQYLNAVAGLAVLVLLVLLFLHRRRCYTLLLGSDNSVQTRNKTFVVHHEHSPLDALSKPTHHCPDRIFTFEAADSDDELRLQIHQELEDVACRYEETTETAPADLVAVETGLRETRIDAQPASALQQYVRALEAQSSVDSDVLPHTDTSLLCSGGEGGSLELTLLYDAPVRSMTVHVLRARSLPNKSHAADMQSQVRVLLLPSKKQKYKTKVRHGQQPHYMESFVFHKINPEDVHGLSMRVRAYGCERMRRQRLLGEAVVHFNALRLERENELWVTLSPRRSRPQLSLPSVELARTVVGVMGAATPSSSAPTPLMTPSGAPDACSLARSDSASSCCSTRSARAELLLGLAYSPVTGHLSVEVIKGTHFRKLSPKQAPDTYVKLCLVSSLGAEMARCKSSRRAQSNPLYKELFIFQVALFQLSEVTLTVSVWWRRSVKRNEMVGWFSLGLNSSGREEARHWREACESRGEQVQRWHVLLDS